jgi:general secretion pathway protein A
MYLEYFGLREFPFSLAPDPRFLYLSAQHREALAHLLYGVRSEGGFVQLTGEVGTGKTTVCRCFLEQLPPGTRAAVILNPALSAEELLAAICDEFQIARPEGPVSVKGSLDLINHFLLGVHAAGERAVLVIDEAQNLDAAVLEQVRLLTNLETSSHKLLQVILMGQPELRATLARPELRQLAQRITARFHLQPLSSEETRAYVRHRLEVAGSGEELFPAPVIGKLRRLSRGVPRLINIMCDRALLGAFVQGQRVVERAALAQAAREVAGEHRGQGRGLQPWSPSSCLVVHCCSPCPGAGSRSLPRLSGGRHRRQQPLPRSPGIRGGRERRTAPGDPSPRPAAGLGFAGARAARGAEAGRGVGGTLPALGDSGGRRGERLRAGSRARTGLPARRGGAGATAPPEPPGRRARLRLAGAPRWLVLELQGRRATLAAGRERTVTDIDELAGYDISEFVLFWRPPARTGGTLAAGDHGGGVAWLVKRLGSPGGAISGAASDPVFDETLTAAVRRFQIAAGIADDGVAGPETLILLDADPAPGTPTLTGAY